MNKLSRVRKLMDYDDCKFFTEKIYNMLHRNKILAVIFPQDKYHSHHNWENSYIVVRLKHKNKNKYKAFRFDRNNFSEYFARLYEKEFNQLLDQYRFQFETSCRLWDAVLTVALDKLKGTPNYKVIEQDYECESYMYDYGNVDKYILKNNLLGLNILDDNVAFNYYLAKEA